MFSRHDAHATRKSLDYGFEDFCKLPGSDDDQEISADPGVIITGAAKIGLRLCRSPRDEQVTRRARGVVVYDSLSKA
jgi:hypothetical protein